MMDLSGAAIDTLLALGTRGSLDDGDLPSKAGMNELIGQKLAMKNYDYALPNFLTTAGVNRYRVEFAERLPGP
jgi:hypothetical protein